MKSKRKRSKAARTNTPVEPEEEEDRLSSLPDSVLCHILSFLPTKYAARTSLLSTRWKYLFLGVQNIDLVDYALSKPNHDFINFVNRRLMLCKTASITEFRLKCSMLPELPVMNSWLTALLFRNIKILEIEDPDSYSRPRCLPSGIFRSETLVVLKLCGRNIALRIPEFVCFRKLKVLNLKDVDIQLESDNNFRLAEGYPLLEELRLERVRFPKNKENKATLGVSIRSLKVLAIIHMKDEFGRIDIETPHLQHLECKLSWISISHIEINCCRCESLLLAYRFYPDVPDDQWLLPLLSKLNSVKELRISGCYMEWDDSPSLPQFPNLTYLELFATGKSVWSLLQLAPNLKTLVCEEISFGKDFFENEPLPPLCFVRTLTEIRIESSRERKHVIAALRSQNNRERKQLIAAIRFFLEHVAVLEKMILKLHSSVELTTSKQLLKQRRLSPKCEVELI